MTQKILAISIVGGSGYVGGEVLRFLLQHPFVEIKQVTSEKYTGKNIAVAHPNLRGFSDLKYTSVRNLDSCDLLLSALPNGVSMHKMDDFMKIAPKIIDLGADFRLKNAADYQKWYGIEHPAPELLEKFVYGVAELHREEIKSANYVAGGGCEATCSILSFYPLLKENIIKDNEIYIDAKIGSSAAGNKATPASHHPERVGCVRSYKPTGHRHTAEITQETDIQTVNLSATAIDMVRGILITGQAKIDQDLTERDIRKIYRQYYGQEPFIRIIKETRGIYRYPEPKLLAGTNFCDIGFAKDPDSDRLVVIGAIDNLVKGAAGQAVQAMNLMSNFPETTGLEFPGLHPV